MEISSFLHGDNSKRYGRKSRNIRKEICFPPVVNHKIYGYKSQDIRKGVTRYAEEKAFPPVMRYKRCGRNIFSPYYIRGRKRKKGKGG